MELNQLPKYDASDNPTGCCPRFKSEGWDKQEIHFKDKLFVRATTRSLFHTPLNMGRVFPKTYKQIEEADAVDIEQSAILSSDLSPWKSKHLFAVTKEVPGLEKVRLSGDYYTRGFDGPYINARYWFEEMKEYVKEKGFNTVKIFFYYTTCPKCAKVYRKNYVIGFAEAA